jgi:hypothetical protein
MLTKQSLILVLIIVWEQAEGKSNEFWQNILSESCKIHLFNISDEKSFEINEKSQIPAQSWNSLKNLIKNKSYTNCQILITNEQTFTELSLTMLSMKYKIVVLLSRYIYSVNQNLIFDAYKHELVFMYERPNGVLQKLLVCPFVATEFRFVLDIWHPNDGWTSGVPKKCARPLKGTTVNVTGHGLLHYIFKESQPMTGIDVDIMTLTAKAMGFKFTIVPAETWGGFDSHTGSWTGIIGKVFL